MYIAKQADDGLLYHLQLICSLSLSVSLCLSLSLSLSVSVSLFLSMSLNVKLVMTKILTHIQTVQNLISNNKIVLVTRFASNFIIYNYRHVYPFDVRQMEVILLMYVI